MNFSKNKILFRCDAGEENELGSGHLFRCLTIARYFCKFYKIKSKEILFVIKSGKKFKNSLKILKNYPFKVLKISYDIKNYSQKEIDLIRKLKADLFIIDRLGKIKKKVSNNNLIIEFEDDKNINTAITPAEAPIIEDLVLLKTGNRL